MKRSGWVTGVIVAQLLYGAFWLGTCVFLLVLIRYPEAKEGKDAAAAIRGLKVGAALVGPVALLVLVGGYGLWKERLLGWWLALLTDVGLAGALLYSMTNDGWSNLDWSMVSFTVAAFALVALLWVPSVRRFYWTGSGRAEPLTKLENAKANRL